MNDSKADLYSNIDRHEHIGLGNIGEEGFMALFSNKKDFRFANSNGNPCRL